MLAACFVLVTFLVAAPAIQAACGNGVVETGEDCDDGSANGNVNSCCTTSCKFSGESPDVIVGDLMGVDRYSPSVNGITAYAVGTYSCNVGSCWLKWISNARARSSVNSTA
jgi:hypothetical protein